MNTFFPDKIDSSMLTSFRACPTKFYWNFLRNLNPPARSVHLVAGGAMASGLEAYRKVIFQPVIKRDPLEAAWIAFNAEWGDYVAPEDSPKDYISTWSALREYVEAHPPLLDVIQPLRNSDGSPTVEFTFAIPLKINHPESGDPILFVGRFDMLGIYGADYGSFPCILDEKTTYTLGPTWSRQWRMRGQFLGYLWALSQLGHKVNHAIVRGIGIQKREIKFLTHIEQYPDYLLTRWEYDLSVTIHNMIQSYIHVTRNGIEPDRNFGDSCSAYGGCQYTDLCAAHDPEAWTSNFTVRTWDPLAKQPLKL